MPSGQEVFLEKLDRIRVLDNILQKAGLHGRVIKIIDLTKVIKAVTAVEIIVTIEVIKEVETIEITVIIKDLARIGPRPKNINLLRQGFRPDLTRLNEAGPASTHLDKADEASRKDRSRDKNFSQGPTPKVLKALK